MSHMTTKATVRIGVTRTVVDAALGETQAAEPRASETRPIACSAAPLALRASRPSVLPHFEADVNGGMQVVHTVAARYRETSLRGQGTDRCASFVLLDRRARRLRAHPDRADRSALALTPRREARTGHA